MKKIFFIALLGVLVFYSCSKKSNETNTKKQGTISFYNIESTNYDTIYIECEGQKGMLTKQYGENEALCGIEGMFKLILDTGLHRYTATAGSLKVEKQVYVKADTCITHGVGFNINLSLLGTWTLVEKYYCGTCESCLNEQQLVSTPCGGLTGSPACYWNSTVTFSSNLTFINNDHISCPTTITETGYYSINSNFTKLTATSTNGEKIVFDILRVTANELKIKDEEDVWVFKK